MRSNVGTLLPLVFPLTFGLGKKVMVRELYAGMDAVVRVRGDVELGCKYEKGDLEGGLAIRDPSCCYFGDHNKMTICEKGVYPGECRDKDTYRVVKEGDAYTGECILLLWNVTKKDEGTYLVVFPGNRADNQPIKIKIKKDITALLDGYHESVVNSSLSQYQKKVELTIALLETEKTENVKLLETEKAEKWKLMGVGLVVGFLLALLAIITNQILSHGCQCKSESDEDQTTRGEVKDLTFRSRESGTSHTSKSISKWSSAYVIDKVAAAIVGFFCPAFLTLENQSTRENELMSVQCE